MNYYQYNYLSIATPLNIIIKQCQIENVGITDQTKPTFTSEHLEASLYKFNGLPQTLGLL